MEKDKKTLLRISIIFSIIGLLLIYISSISIEPEFVKIGDISKEDLGEHIKIRGKIIEETISDGTLFLQLKNNSNEISVVKFNYKGAKLNKTSVVVSGKVNLYESKLEIIAERIERS